MGFKNGIHVTDKAVIVQFKAGGERIRRKFPIFEYGSTERALEEAQHYVKTRKELLGSKPLSTTGVKHVYECIRNVRVKGYSYRCLYLRLFKPQTKERFVYIGSLSKHTMVELRSTMKYKDTLQEMTVEAHTL